MDHDELELIEPCTLYNFLQQTNVRSCLSDPNYLLLGDARTKSEYNESHILTAKKAPKNDQGLFSVPYDAELECKQNIVVYDSNTSSVKKQDAPAVQYGRLLWRMGSRHQVKILRGGYELFSALYPFLRTQKIFFMPRELDDIKPYPVEILQGSLYMGNWQQGNAAYIQKDLKIKAHVNVCMEKEKFFKEAGPELLHIMVEDDNEANLFMHFEKAVAFIESYRKQKEAVLVFSRLGISRAATIVVAYLMSHKTWPVELAYHYVEKCQSAMRPNRGFLDQLSMWEETLFGTKASSMTDYTLHIPEAD